VPVRYKQTLLGPEDTYKNSKLGRPIFRYNYIPQLVTILSAMWVEWFGLKQHFQLK